MMLLLLTGWLLAACQTAEQPPVLIEAVIIDGFALANADELILLINVGAEPVDLSGWRLTDADGNTAVFPPDATIEPGAPLWLSKNGTLFGQEYVKVADFELVDSSPLIPDLLGSWPGLTDAGDTLRLLDADGCLVDLLHFGAGIQPNAGWQGTAVDTAQADGEGGFWVRRRDANGLPLDSDSAADWQMQDGYTLNGRVIASPRR